MRSIHKEPYMLPKAQKRDPILKQLFEKYMIGWMNKHVGNYGAELVHKFCANCVATYNNLKS